MTPLRRRRLAAAVVLLAALTLALARVTDGVLRPIPRSAPVTLLLLAIAVGLTSVSLRNRLAGRPGTKPVLPTGVARALAFGRASAIAGAVVAGPYLGLALDRLLDVATRPSAPADLAVAGTGGVAGLLLLVAGLRLERACRAG